MEQPSETPGQELEAKASELRNQGKGYEAVEAYKQARAAYLQQGEKVKAAGCTHMIGVSYKIENDLERALPVYEQAAQEYEETGDALGPGRVYRDVGIMFEYHDRFEEAGEYLQKSRAALEAAPDEASSEFKGDGEPSKDAELGITLSKIGLLRLRQLNFSEAESYLHQGLTLTRKAGHAFYEMTTLSHLGALELERQQPERALTHLEAALGIIYEQGMQDEQTRRCAQIWGLMAHAYFNHNNPAVARRYAEKSFAVINTLSENAQGPVLKDIQAEKLKKQLETL